MNVLIVIVNFRSAGLAIDCLRSLEPEVAAMPGAHAVVVENGSGDDSADRLAAAIAENGWGSWAELAIAPRNGGFAAGNNVAIAPALASPSPPDLVWLLNPDTVVRPGALGALVEFLEGRPDVGLAGSRLEHPDASPQGSAYRFPAPLHELNRGLQVAAVGRLLDRFGPGPVPDYEWPRVPDRACRVDWVAGASLMVRREVFGAIGLLDEGYFMYFEEVDFCLKAGRAGWPCWYVPASRVVHLVGQSSGVTRAGDERKRLPSYWFEARRRFFLSNYGRARTLTANLLYTVGYSTSRLRRLVRRKPDQDPRWMLWDFIRYNFLTLRSR
jgi:GT2 family glycosyltransferase